MKHSIVIGGSVLLQLPASGESPMPCCNGKRGAFDEAFDEIKQERLATNGIGAWLLLNKSQGGWLGRYVAVARWCNKSVNGVALASSDKLTTSLLMALGWVARPHTDPIYQEFPTVADPARPAALPRSEAHAGMRTVFIVRFR